MARLSDGEVARCAVQIARELPNRYHLLGYISRGAFATVWRAFDHLTGRLVAVKRFETIGGSRGGDYYKELRALFLLRHERIVELHDLLETPEGRRYLILEFCAGGTLRRALGQARRQKMLCSSERVRELGLHLAEGLVAAHSAGLVHRDLKPENVLFVATGAGPFQARAPVKIADFGLARADGPRFDADRLMNVSGSPTYMAPEQFTANWTTASDLYALGVILYELLHGRQPFRGGPQELARQHLYETPVLAPTLPVAWRDLLTALMSKEPTQRPNATGLVARLLLMRDSPRRTNMKQEDREAAWQRDEQELEATLSDLAGLTDESNREEDSPPVEEARLPSLDEVRQRTDNLMASLFHRNQPVTPEVEQQPTQEPEPVPNQQPAEGQTARQRVATWNSFDTYFGDNWDQPAESATEEQPGEQPIEEPIRPLQQAARRSTDSPAPGTQRNSDDVFGGFNWE